MVTIKAKKIRRGHSIPGLDNAFVIDAERDGDDVTLTFNDARGEEGTITCPSYMPITVDAEEPNDIWGD